MQNSFLIKVSSFDGGWLLSCVILAF